MPKDFDVMDYPEPVGALEDLEASVSDAARVLPSLKGLEKELCNELRGAASDYLLHLAEEDTSPTVATVLNELQRLSNAMKEGGRIRGQERLHPQTGRALAGLFPAAQGRIIEIGSGKIAAPLILQDDEFATTLKSLTAWGYQNGQVALFVVRRPSTEHLGALASIGIWYGEEPDFPVKREDIRQAVKSGLASSLKEAFDFTIRRVRDTFCLEEGDKPGTKDIRRALQATAKWEVAADVGRALTDLGLRMLSGDSHNVARDLVDATIVYATNSPPEHTAVCKELIKKAFSITVQIAILYETTGVVDERILNIQAELETRGDTHRRSKILYGLAFYPLLDWRRELERRLKYGDYRPDDNKLRRPSGPVVIIPNWPHIDDRWSVSRKLIRLKHASKPLQNPKYLSCL